MKITDVKSFLVNPGVGKNWILVKVETDEGLYGWGEAYSQADRDKAIVAHIDALKRYLLGRSPLAIKHFTHWAYMDFTTKRGAMDFYCAMSGIEHALWDIAGKASNQPVYNLLGGPVRDKIRVYANGWSGGAKTPQALAEKAKKIVGMGFTAMKFDPFPEPWRQWISKEDEHTAVDNVRAVREAVGPKVDILIEVHRRLAPMHAERVAWALEEFKPFWFEEPVSSQNIDALAEVRSRIRIPVVTGEELYTKAQFREVFEKRAADILNPDIANCGGILELKEIAAMAEPYYVVMSPHNYNSTTMALAATVNLCAAIPNFLITEYFVNFTEVGAAVAPNCLRQEKGYIKIPARPGLGVEIDEAALVKYPYKPFPQRHIRDYPEEGP